MSETAWVALLNGTIGTAVVLLITWGLRRIDSRRKERDRAEAERIKQIKAEAAERAKQAEAERLKAEELALAQANQEIAIREATERMSDKLFKRLEEDGEKSRMRLRDVEKEFEAFRASTNTRIDTMAHDNETLRAENNQLRYTNGQQAGQIEAQGKRITALEQQVEGLKADREVLVSALRARDIPLPAELYRRKTDTGPLVSG